MGYPTQEQRERMKGITPGTPPGVELTYEPLTMTRELGHPITVDTAPARTKMDLGLLMNGRAYIYLLGDGSLNIADQVVYRITGYDPADGALLLELVADHRPADAPGFA
ncbi:hypothetical protein PV350_04880 [Streptomyces sp. PA03-6a]|nr:hypothetical protein [Streptomyces sp. PA03-6a]